MYDLHHICESADAWAALFDDAGYIESIVAQCTCRQIDLQVNLLLALDNDAHASVLMDRHVQARNCRPVHTAEVCWPTFIGPGAYGPATV